MLSGQPSTSMPSMPRVCFLRQTKMWKLLKKPPDHFLSFPFPGLWMDSRRPHAFCRISSIVMPFAFNSCATVGVVFRTKFLRIYLNYRCRMIKQFTNLKRSCSLGDDSANHQSRDGMWGLNSFRTDIPWEVTDWRWSARRLPQTLEKKTVGLWLGQQLDS